MREHGYTTMLSRVADSLYWMSRYLERAEHTARVFDVELQLRLDQSPESGASRWSRMLQALQVPASLVGRVEETSLIETLTLDRSSPSSIVSCLAAARENLRNIREQCSTEMWEHLNRLYLRLVSRPVGEVRAFNSQFFREVLEGTHLFHGLADSTMSHGEGWQYIQLGRYVERTDALAALIGSHFSGMSDGLDQVVEAEAYLEWVGLLKSCAAFEAYCKNYTAELRPLRVAEFLLLNPDFPHSVRFSVDMVHAALRAVGELTERKAEWPVRITGRLRATLSFSQIEEIMIDNGHAYLNDVRQQCAQASTAINQIYFDYPIETTLVS